MEDGETTLGRQQMYDATGHTYEEGRYGSSHMRGYLETRNDALTGLLSEVANGSAEIRVLDVGAGTGLTASHVASLSDRYKVFATDFSWTMLDQATRRLRDVGDSRVAQADATRLPFPADTFDVVYATRFIHQFADKGPVVRELLRVTKPGGCLALEFYGRPYHWLRYFVTSRHQSRGAYLSHFPRRREVRELMGKSARSVPLRVGGARFLATVFGEDRLRRLTGASERFPLSVMVDEYFVFCRKPGRA